jgi:dipeptidyl aminopeptidase/acylaminoacyl peptidase
VDPLLDQIARAPEIDFFFSYDPASDRLAFAHSAGEQGLFVLDLQHPGSLRRVGPQVNWPRRPALAPSGRRLVATDLQQSTVFLVPVDGAAMVQPIVRIGRGDAVKRMVFSPDGKRLVYELTHPESGRPTELRMIDVSTLADARLPTGEGAAWAPAFTPDGAEIFFLSERCVQRLPLADGRAHTVACVDGAPMSGVPDLPALSPDGRRLAFTIERDDCLHLVLIELGRGTWRVLEPETCGMRPTFLSDDTLAYIASTPDAVRAPRVLSLTEGVSHDLGFTDGVTYELARTADGRLLALLAGPTLPRSLWRLDPSGQGRERVAAPLDGATLTALGEAASVPVAERVRSSDGLSVPILVFAPSPHPRRGRGGRGPAVLLLHGGDQGREDIAPRWDNTIQYLTRAGIGVVAVNYRGSTGYGTAYRERYSEPTGKVADVRAALAHLPSLSWVDPRQMFLLSVSSAASIAAAVVRSDAQRLRGAIQWLSPAEPWRGTRSTPLLWISGTLEKGAENATSLAAELRRRGLDLTWVKVPDGHQLRMAENQRQALSAVERFISRRRPLF